MRAEILIHGNDNPATNYLTWSPAQCQIFLAEADGAVGSVRVRLSNQDPGRGGQVVFYDQIPSDEQDDLMLDLPANGDPVDFYLAGKFGSPSEEDQDAAVEVMETSRSQTIGLEQLMVRVRKNANDLTAGERTRFLDALGRLNDRGMGAFTNFRNMHTFEAVAEAHGDAAFLPWHRAYLLDLERELQNFDASVTVPYWKFDERAPRLFRRNFMGVATASGSVDFDSDNPLISWVSGQGLGITRRPLFNTQTEPASRVRNDEDQTMDLGNGNYVGFRFAMELDPHGSAHVSFGGDSFLGDPHTATWDPLFFLLHSNVDRLWAKWQWLKGRFNVQVPETYNPDRVKDCSLGGEHLGQNLAHTMWPWNGVTQNDEPCRPIDAPGGTFPDSIIVQEPGINPTVEDMIDFQGVIDIDNCLGFDYDNVPFEFEDQLI